MPVTLRKNKLLPRYLSRAWPKILCNIPLLFMISRSAIFQKGGASVQIAIVSGHFVSASDFIRTIRVEQEIETNK